jgi:hypothetical protein
MEAIRQALLETTLEISVNEIFCQAFCERVEGMTPLKERLYSIWNEDLHRDYKTLGLLEEGFGNLKCCFTLCFLQ